MSISASEERIGKKMAVRQVNSIHVVSCRWDPKTFDEFDARANCLKKEYSSFGPEDPVYGGRHVDGDNTLGENIADEVCACALKALF